MIASAFTMGVFGISALFLPQEILTYMQVPLTGFMTMCLQIMGALYLGFAMMNWMAKTVLIGGIYSRPLAIGNLFHFTVGSITLLKGVLNQPDLKYFWILCGPYSIFAICFGIVAFTSPSRNISK